ncbi:MULTISPECIES: DUF2946 domain-containing protein [Pandoraea]|uniref:DUF2946 domain-containing protein n=1 Tax=Pandoraea TaxID=93217 RepID=UPI001F5D2F23|nr:MULTISPECIES: DUF2946 domain-containing protein [Pandoraea]MCI3208113.1 hypothetical protein [Pandoraea sp. LA3]MDN4586142.1 hypothetical protein [Pandoraea capi]
MSLTSRTRLTAWLGLAAMWLAVCMPVVSQVLAAHRAEQARLLDVAFCTVDGAARTVPTLAATSNHMHDGEASASRLSHTPQMSHADHSAHETQGDICGYCSLLANHPPLVMPALTGAVSFAWIARAGPVARTLPSTPQFAYTPPARAPPALS